MMHTPDTKTIITLGIGGLLGFGVSYWLTRRQSIDATIPISPPSHSPSIVSLADHLLTDDILREQFTRNMQFFGPDKQLDIAKSFVVVIGLGGVGSHAAHLLARSGVGRLLLVDFDQVSLSSLNRHAVATRQDVGLPKATVLARHLANIVPECRVEAMVAMYNASSEEAILGQQPDFVLDAIDNIDTKVDLLAACHKRSIRVLSSAGAGARADPTRLHIADIAHVTEDQLGRKVKMMLRARNIATGIPMLFSTERPRLGLVDSLAPDENPLDYQVIPGFRVRTIPVLGTMPAMFGMAAAAYILTELADWGMVTQPVVHFVDKMYETQFNRLVDREVARFGNLNGLHVDRTDVVYLVREAFRGESVLFGGGKKDKKQQKMTDHLVLTRWRADLPASIGNLVLMTLQEADLHDAGKVHYEHGQVERIERLLDRIAKNVV